MQRWWSAACKSLGSAHMRTIDLAPQRYVVDRPTDLQSVWEHSVLCRSRELWILTIYRVLIVFSLYCFSSLVWTCSRKAPAAAISRLTCAISRLPLLKVRTLSPQSTWSLHQVKSADPTFRKQDLNHSTIADAVTVWNCSLPKFYYWEHWQYIFVWASYKIIIVSHFIIPQEI